MGHLILLTNNPLAASRFQDRADVRYLDAGYKDILREARDLIHRGAVLLFHPLYGSVKPGETPYRTLLLDVDTGRPIDIRSLDLIEAALRMCDAFADRSRLLDSKVLEDFQKVDAANAESGFSGSPAQ